MMPTQEQLNAAQLELGLANDEYAALADRYNKYKELFQSYREASPETQDRAEEAMGRALDDFYNTEQKMHAAEDRIQQAQSVVNQYSAAIAAAQQAAAQQTVWQRRRTYVSNPTPTPTPNIIPEGLTPPEEWWTPIYNDKWELAWWQWPLINLNQPQISPYWQELAERQKIYGKPQVNSSPAAITVDEWINWTLSQWKWIGPMDYIKWAWHGFTDTYMNPNAIVYEKRSNEPGYNIWAKWWVAWTVISLAAWWGGLKWLGWSSAGWTTYTVANSWRGVYNTPNAWKTVNRAWSNYSPAYWGNGVRTLKTSAPNLNLTSSEGRALAKHLVNWGEYPISSLTPTTARRLAY